MSLRTRVLMLLALVAVCLAVATRVHVSSALTDAIPADGPAGAALRDIERFSLLDTILIDLDASEHPDQLGAAIEAVGARLAARDDFSVVRYHYGLDDGIQLQRAATPSLAVLTPEDVLRARLSPAGMLGALQLAAAQMAGPTGSLVAARLERDPLDLGTTFTEGALRQGAGSGVELVDGHLVTRDGKHGLILARAKTPALGTSLESPIILHIEEDLASSPVPASWIGSHRYAAEAQEMIKKEMNIAVSAGVGLVLLVFLVAFRSLRPILGTIPATIVGSAAAAAAAALASPVHGIALAFGGALASMGVDYWIHLYLTGIRDGVPATFEERLEVGKHALAHLLPAYRISVAATVTSFLMLATSSYPVVSDIGWIGVGVALGAISSVVLAGPIVFAALARPGDRLPTIPLPSKVPGWIAGSIVVVLTLVSIASWSVEFNGDPRAMDARAPETAVLEQTFQERYGGASTTGLVVAEGADLDAALDALAPAIDALRNSPGAHVQSPLPLLPAPSQRAARTALLGDHDADFLAASDAAGFDGAALLPAFRASVAATTPPTLDTWKGTPAEDMLARTVHVGPEGAAVAAIVSVGTQEALDHARREVELSGAKVRFVHPAAVAEDGAHRIRVELMTRSGFALVAVLLYMILRYRDVPRFLAAAMPSLAAVGGTLGCLSLADIPLTPVSGPAFVLILGLAFDQGIFLVEADEMSESAFRSARAAIVVALSTALAGFVGLCFADYPAVWSVGLVVSLGIAWTALGAFFVVPAILTDDGTAATRRWFHRALTAGAIWLSLDAIVSVLGRLPPPEALQVGPLRGKMERVDGIWTYYLEGNATQLGHDVATLTGTRQDAMESSAEGEFRKHVPFGLARYLLARLTPTFAGTMVVNVPTSMLQEIDGGAVVGEDPMAWLAPRYTRKVCLHALHDLGQAMVDAPWVQGCTGFVASGDRTVDGHLLMGRNWDFDGGRFFDEDKAVIAERREGAIPFVHVAIPGLVGSVSGINEAQIGVVVLAAASDAKIRLTTPMIFIIREILESATTLEDVQRLLDEKRGFVSENVLAVDGRSGKAALFEVTPDDVTRIDAGTTMAVANHLRGPHANDDMNQLRRAEGTTVPREARMEELLAEPGPIDVQRAISILTDTRGVGGKELPAGHEAAINARNTSHSVLIDATAMQLYVSRYPNVDGGFVRFAVADLLAGKLVGERVSEPIDPEAAFRVHLVRDLVRNHADDEASMQKALRLNPGDPDATLALARIYKDSGRAAEATKLLDGFIPEREGQARLAEELRR